LAEKFITYAERARLNDVVFTALFGDYETLNEVKVTRGMNSRFLCFTDNPKLKSDTWEIVVTPAKVPGDSIRSSRVIKMLGYQDFPKGTRSLYVDNSVSLIANPSDILDDWLQAGPMAFMHHSTRATVRDEFFVCSAYGLDNPSKIYSQYNFYKRRIPHILAEKPFWGGMIARVSDDSVDTFMNEWFSQYMRFARRDQLGINASAALTGISISAIEGRNDLAWSHNWPVVINRKNEIRDSIGQSVFRKPKIVLNGIRYAPRFYLK
jgi:Protein of unknown function (DUF616)